MKNNNRASRLINSTSHKFKSTYFKSISKVVLGIVCFLIIGISLSLDTFAQSTSGKTVCDKLNSKELNVELAGIFARDFLKFTARINKVDYEFYVKLLKPKRDQTQMGVAMTKYYNARLKRTQYVSQIIRVCQSYNSEVKAIIVSFFGFDPMDVDTKSSGSNLTYSADNFFVVSDGDNFLAFTKDDAGQESSLEVGRIGSLPTDIEDKFYQVLVDKYNN